MLLSSPATLASNWKFFRLCLSILDEKFKVAMLILLVVWKERDFELRERDGCFRYEKSLGGWSFGMVEGPLEGPDGFILFIERVSKRYILNCFGMENTIVVFSKLFNLAACYNFAVEISRKFIFKLILEGSCEKQMNGNLLILVKDFLQI